MSEASVDKTLIDQAFAWLVTHSKCPPYCGVWKPETAPVNTRSPHPSWYGHRYTTEEERGECDCGREDLHKALCWAKDRITRGISLERRERVARAIAEDGPGVPTLLWEEIEPHAQQRFLEVADNVIAAMIRDGTARGDPAVARVTVENGKVTGVEKVGPTPPDGEYLVVPTLENAREEP